MSQKLHSNTDDAVPVKEEYNVRWMGIFTFIFIFFLFKIVTKVKMRIFFNWNAKMMDSLTIPMKNQLNLYLWYQLHVVTVQMRVEAAADGNPPFPNVMKATVTESTSNSSQWELSIISWNRPFDGEKI